MSIYRNNSSLIEKTEIKTKKSLWIYENHLIQPQKSLFSFFKSKTKLRETKIGKLEKNWENWYFYNIYIENDYDLTSSTVTTNM